MPYPTLASFIRAHRERLSLTRADLARKVGVHAAQVTRWEDGDFKPSTSRLVALARALNVEPVDLMAAVCADAS